MPRFEVVDGKPWHVGQILHRIRHGHRGCLGLIGMRPAEVHLELRRVFDDSAFRRAWLMDGKLAALGGVTGGLLSPHGFIWLALSQEVLRYPVRIVAEARRQLGEIMQTKTELATTILAHDDVALRFSCFLGFHAIHDKTFGGWRQQLRLLNENPALRIPVGSGYALALGYHEGTS